MPDLNFTLADAARCTLAFVLFPLFVFVPGYVLAWLGNLLDFRRRTVPARAAISVPLSIALSPGLAYLVGKAFGFPAVWGVFAALWIGFAVIAVREYAQLKWDCSMELRHVWILRAFAAVWILVAAASLIDWQWGERLYYSVVSYDYSVRVSFTSAISRDGLAAANPFFQAAHSYPLRYHHFWLILCSLVDLLGGSAVSARQAVIGGTIWCGLGLMALVPLCLRFVHPKGAVNLGRRTITGILLFLVTGLDLIPTLILFRQGVMFPEMEWWNNEQVTSWIGSVLWVPHHVAGLIAGVTALVLLHAAWNCQERWRWPEAVAAGFAIGACFGASAYVALPLAVFLSVWLGFAILRRQWRNLFTLAAGGAVALCVCLPHFLVLVNTSGPSVSPLRLGIRQFAASPVVREALRLPPPGGPLSNLLLLPLGYTLEFGFFLLAGGVTCFLYARRKRLDRFELASLVVAGVSLLICTTVRSSLLTQNDLGRRGMLWLQIVLLLWAVDLFDAVPSRLRSGLATMLLVVGVAGTFYEVGILRMFPILSDNGMALRNSNFSLDTRAGERTYYARQMYETLKARIPERAIVQHNPRAPGDFPFGLYAERATAVEEPGCATVFGGDPAVCAQISPRMQALFNGPANARDVKAACRAAAIDVLVAGDTDPVWQDRSSWVWTEKPIAANPMLRALACVK